MDIKIRPVKVEDAADINEFRVMDGVYENTLAVFSERIMSNIKFIENLSEDDHIFVAELKENDITKVVGIAGLHAHTGNRVKHCANIGMMIHATYHNKGIGKLFMSKLIDLADNWLMLKRLELDVFTDNVAAIALYKKYGFEMEGTKKYAAVKNGKYADLHLMARYNL